MQLFFFFVKLKFDIQLSISKQAAVRNQRGKVSSCLGEDNSFTSLCSEPWVLQVQIHLGAPCKAT